MSDYIVIFEHTAITGGFYKTRVRTDYRNKAEFEAMYKEYPELKVHMEGISEDEAERQLYSVPMICHYTAAVEELFEDPNIELDWERMEWVFTNANFAAEHSAARAHKLGLKAELNRDLIDHLAMLKRGDSKKAKLMKAVIDAYNTERDEVNPTLLQHNLLINFIDIIC